MKKILFLLLLPFYLVAQNVTIKNAAYESLFSKKYNQPLYVKYILYKGGGDCDRKQFRFKKDKVDVSNKDYNGTGYDEGHLANAEDFAYDCTKMELTFRFYNCIAQTPKLNRGKWKTFETNIRELSQTDSLLIICGGIYGKEKINTKLTKAEYCFKIVYSFKKKKVIFCKIFDNKSKDNTVRDITIKELEKLAGINLI